MWDLFLKILTFTSLTVVSRLRSFFDDFFDFFFAQNDSEWFNSQKKVVEIEIWEFRPPIGSLGPRLSHFSPIFKNEDLVNFFDFGWLDMLDIAYYDITNSFRLLDNHQLPDLMV